MNEESMVSDELLPCPFCGGKAGFVDVEANDRRKAMLGVECGTCGADIVTRPESYAPQPKHDILMGAARAWNTRSKPVAGVEVKPLVGFLWQEFCELPDRSSPEEYPDMALVSLPELTAIVETFAERQALSFPAQEPVAVEKETRFPCPAALCLRTDGICCPDDECDHETGIYTGAMGASPFTSPQPEAVISEEMRTEALRLLKARDERDDKVHEIIEDLREIVLLMPAASRPDGLFKRAQDAVYAMRGRTRLMDDAALTAALKAPSDAS